VGGGRGVLFGGVVHWEFGISVGMLWHAVVVHSFMMFILPSKSVDAHEQVYRVGLCTKGIEMEQNYSSFNIDTDERSHCK
jgi:hypothetical protein